MQIGNINQDCLFRRLQLDLNVSKLLSFQSCFTICNHRCLEYDAIYLKIDVLVFELVIT